MFWYKKLNNNYLAAFSAAGNFWFFDKNSGIEVKGQS
mgnify:CR=1 FL=1